MTYNELKNKYCWLPIRGCPGRYKLKHENTHLSPAELTESDQIIRPIKTDKTKDLVLITRLEDGGLISYQRPDGSILHTLNTPEGFNRKLKMLGIKMEL